MPSGAAPCRLRLAFACAISLCLFSHVQAAEVTAAQAEAKAAQSETSLSPEQLQNLVRAQGALANTAFPGCMSLGAASPTKFTVIVELGASGDVKNSWVLSDSKNEAFGQCFREAMIQGFRYTPPLAPFFTSFEYSSTK